jgi:hypothetical protein
LGIESLHNKLVLLVELLVLIIVKTLFKIKYWPLWSGTPLTMGIPEKSHSLVLSIKILHNNVPLQFCILVGIWTEWDELYVVNTEDGCSNDNYPSNS